MTFLAYREGREGRKRDNLARDIAGELARRASPPQEVETNGLGPSGKRGNRARHNSHKRRRAKLVTRDAK